MQRAGLIALSTALLIATSSVIAASVEIQLPLDTSKLRPSKLPGYALAQQKCGICHSANYISFQPPGMTQTQWTNEMTKMQHSYGAPINDDEVKLIGAYLAVAYGSAKATDATVVALTAIKPTDASGGQADDIQALLNSNGCLGCHSIDKKVVGPAFKDVAAKYKSDPQATTKLAVRIRAGGTGKWGQVAMPPMSALSEPQARALAGYVLKQ